jgi:hypothetical protein
MQALVFAGQDVKFRDGYAPLPFCRVSQFLAASFAVFATFSSLPRLMDA